jgi:hypothetical protein
MCNFATALKQLKEQALFRFVERSNTLHALLQRIEIWRCRTNRDQSFQSSKRGKSHRSIIFRICQFIQGTANSSKRGMSIPTVHMIVGVVVILQALIGSSESFDSFATRSLTLAPRVM